MRSTGDIIESTDKKMNIRALTMTRACLRLLVVNLIIDLPIICMSENLES